METKSDKYARFFEELNTLFDKYLVYIDCGIPAKLRVQKTHEIIAELYGDCEPDYEE